LIRHASQITQLAAKYRLPGIYGVGFFMEAGGQNPWPHHPAVAAAAGGSSHRMNRRTFTADLTGSKTLLDELSAPPT
jgi:hypothetical protein